ncbi:sugar kinase [Actinocatenispora thailandica]|uniref:Sugar kinase n=1 Tax=Actinocatenispora thailandica TaxID=227318 RepID=A0A7R7DQ32_9ACTN|nr:ROK family transcriptional regulator [Actinocatenispora thailandica]BCJ35714.1 sugar kinase [Actinocatenispora thailandica]
MGERDESTFTRARLRGINERLLLDRLRALGPTSRAELARRTGLSKPTVSAALASLESAGLVRAAGSRPPAGRGRIALLYEADPTAGYVAGVDIGRGLVRAALADLSGEIIARAEAPNRARSGAALAELVVATARDAVSAARIGWSRVDRVVIGTPGVYEPDADRIRYAVNLPGWGRPGVRERLHAALGTDVELHNDANLAALAEYRYGVGAGSRLFVYLWIGTGLGLGVVAGGAPFVGAHGAAGEIGFLPMAPDAPVGTGAPRGVLETAVSADSVVQTAQELGMPGRLSARQVFDAARAGDERAVATVRREGERLAYVAAAVSAVLDPDLIALGGTVGGNADLLLAPVRHTLPRLTPLRPHVTVGTLADPVLRGACARALDTARDDAFVRRAGTG